jgi:hypothetical protein
MHVGITKPSFQACSLEIKNPYISKAQKQEQDLQKIYM